MVQREREREKERAGKESWFYYHRVPLAVKCSSFACFSFSTCFPFFHPSSPLCLSFCCHTAIPHALALNFAHCLLSVSNVSLSVKPVLSCQGRKDVQQSAVEWSLAQGLTCKYRYKQTVRLKISLYGSLSRGRKSEGNWGREKIIVQDSFTSLQIRIKIFQF